MAGLLRSAKSGSNWTRHELRAFNIEVQTVVDAAAFFNLNAPAFPAATVSETILNNLDKPDGPLLKFDQQFFQYLRAAELSEESAVDDFAAYLLRILDYDSDSRVIRLKKELSFCQGSVSKLNLIYV